MHFFRVFLDGYCVRAKVSVRVRMRACALFVFGFVFGSRLFSCLCFPTFCFVRVSMAMSLNRFETQIEPLA